MENRIQSIDAYRALTMLLMVWVNDFWSLSEIPEWLKHVSATTDGMGFSDVIFPVFLFIVGLSIPFAIRARERKGSSRIETVGHLFSRSAALILMGLMMVNLESYHEASTFLPKGIWQVLMILSFFLIWNHYPKSENLGIKKRALQASGWALIVFLLAIFRSNPENGYNWIETHWWGILGLIGWSYLICALIALAVGQNLKAAIGAWAFFVLFNIAVFAQWLGFLDEIRGYVWIIGGGSLPALTMSGCLVSLLLTRFSKNGQLARFCLLVAGVGFACIVIGLLLRPLGGISKILATPSWTQICTGIGMVSFSAIFWIVDIRKVDAWIKLIKPAGAATLTCYMLPYVAYPLFVAIGFDLPKLLTHGSIGLLQSLFFAFAIVGLTGLLNRFGLKLGV